jgi:lipopolysaccharide export LptBFGC system permease protein LptF
MRRMPWLLYRMMLSDLLRVIGLTVIVLVTVIAFGATIKPLASDSLLDAGQTFKYLLLAIVPMLQFALPFSAGFGPIIALGAALCLIMIVLTQEVIPRFWSLIEQTIARDVTKMFQASIRRGEPFKLGDLQIYADEIIVQNSPEGREGPTTRMHLLKVAAAELDGEGRVILDVTANRAVVDIYRSRSNGESLLKLAMYDTVAYKSTTGDLSRFEVVAPPRAMVIPGVLRDEAKAKSRSELLELRKNPDAYAQVIEARQALADAITDTEARLALDKQLREDGQVQLLAPEPPGQSDATEPAGSQYRFTVKADRLVDGRFMTRDGRRIEVIQSDGDVVLRRFITDLATLVHSPEARLGAPTFDLILDKHEVTDLRTGTGPTPRQRLVSASLTVAGTSNDDVLALPSPGLIGRAERLRDASRGRAVADDKRLQERIDKVHNEIDSLQREITSRLLDRYALSVTAPLLLIVGAILAMYLRGTLPLTIYLLSFLPSVIDLILISAGEQLLRDGRAIGGPIMWSGNALMLGIIAFAYARLSRN